MQQPEIDQFWADLEARGKRTAHHRKQYQLQCRKADLLAWSMLCWLVIAAGYAEMYRLGYQQAQHQSCPFIHDYCQ